MIVKRRILYANKGEKTIVLANKKSITISPFERASVRVITVQSKFVNVGGSFAMQTTTKLR
jgi:hypothetical protein